jgi:diguanylate cyclase (GGDEF)-like protein
VKEWLVDATMRDELTGVGNRRAAEEALEHMTAGDACVLLDLDNFKQVNDTKGHQAGDDMLRFFAAHLLGSLPRRRHRRALRGATSSS